MNIPNRFTNLVEIVEKKYPKTHVVESDEYLWSRFCWTVLLGGNRTEAEVNYVYNLLNEYDLIDRELLEDDWVEYSIECLKDAEDEAEEPNLNGKVGAIHKIEVDLENIHVTLRNADGVFENMGINAGYLQEIAGNHEKEKNLLVSCQHYNVVRYIRYKLHNQSMRIEYEEIHRDTNQRRA